MILSLAPMEGITGHVFRRVHAECFGALDCYYTPFLPPPRVGNRFGGKAFKEIDPANNQGLNVVPQLMSKNADEFVWAAQVLADMGYREVNLNLGCPSGTVVAKGKGSGFLAFPEELEAFFGRIFSEPGMPRVSVKTRLGKTTAEGFPALLELYNDYPIRELIVHPRVQADQYHGQPDLEAFAYALAHSRAPVCYNGDLFDAPAVHAFQARFPAVERIMLGRGLAANPGLIGQLRTGKAPTAAQLQLFHDRLYAATRARIPDRRALLFRMKEAWRYLGCSFADAERPLRRIRKAQDMTEYDSAVRQLFASCPGLPCLKMCLSPAAQLPGTNCFPDFVLWMPAAVGPIAGLRLPAVGCTVAHAARQAAVERGA